MILISYVVFKKHPIIFVQYVLSEAATCSVKKVFLLIPQNSQENTCTRVSFLSKKKPWHRCFLVSFAKFLRTPSFKEHLRWLLLESVSTFLLPRFLLSSWYYRVILCISRGKSPFALKQLTSRKPALNNHRTFTFRFVTFEFYTFDFYV